MKKNWLILLTVTWILKSFFSLSELESFMNKLPLAEALNAKVIVLDSQRSFALNSPYYLLYPQGIK
jgi:hypothetical protein